MTTVLEIVALLLPVDDREAVMGDLEEQKQPGWLRLIAVLSFAVRQQAEYWRHWCSWVVGATVIPTTLLLLGASFRLSLEFRDLLHGGDFEQHLLYRAALMIAWPGTGGFVIGALSRRTGWISPLFFTIPCFSCLMEFREPSLSSLCLLLFIPPGVAGAIFGRRWMRLGLATSLTLMCATLCIMLLWHDMPVLNWLLLVPSLYLTWVAARPNQLEQERFS
jgi:hypothetical protein